MWYHGLKLVPNSGVLHVNGKCLPLGSERQYWIWIWDLPVSSTTPNETCKYVCNE